ncbi:MAG: HTH-type transcriptional regulator ArgP [Holosporales bacterium]
MYNSIFTRNIQYLVTVSKKQNISLAAKHLYVSQAAVSLGIKALEQNLGVPLIIRSKGCEKVILTDKAKEIVALIERQQNEYENVLSNEHQVTLKIAAIPYFAQNYLIPLLQKLELLPFVKIFQVNSSKAENAILNEKIDMAFFSSQKTPATKKNYIYPIFREQIAIVGLKRKFSKIEMINSIEDLKQFPLITGNDPNRVDWFNSLDDTSGRYWSDNTYSTKSLILNGCGIAVFQLEYFTPEELAKISIAKIRPSGNEMKLYGVLSQRLEGKKEEWAKKIITNLKK